MTQSPSIKHQRILGNLYLAFGNFLKEHKAGKAFVAPCDVVEPDLLFVSSGRTSIITEKNIQGGVRPCH